MQSQGKTIYKEFQGRADDLLAELLADEDKEWFAPGTPESKTDHLEIFGRSRQKFVNGNLNAADFMNMVCHAYDENAYWYDKFKSFRQLSEDAKPVVNQFGRLGKVMIWKVPPNLFIKPHVDYFPYHLRITRWVYMLNGDPDTTYAIIDDKKIDTCKGDLWKLYPATEKHSFINAGTEPWYFLCFDIWDEEKLAAVAPMEEITAYSVSPNRSMYHTDHGQGLF